jgi:flagellar hook-associated protein 3 FlgL
MRVTQRMMTEKAVQHMDENLQRLYALQEKVASGKAFQRPSDDPAGVTAALSLRSQLEALQGYLDAAHLSDDWMSATDFALQQMMGVASRAYNLALSGASDSQGAQERRAFAAEIDVLLRQAIDLANTSHKDNYLFAGFKVNSPPFSGVDGNGDGLYEAVTYQGDGGVILRHLGPGQSMPQNVDGDATFAPLFQALIRARDALNANDVPAIQAALGDLNAALEGVSTAHTINGARQRQVRLVGERLEKTQIEIRKLLSSKEDVNMAEAISNLQQQETVYRTVLEVAQRALSALSLFDLLS